MDFKIPDLLVPRTVIKVMDERDLTYFSVLCLLNMPSTDYIKHRFNTVEDKEYVLANINTSEVRSIGPGDPGNPLSVTITLKSRPQFDDQKQQDEVTNWYCKMFSDIYECELENRRLTKLDQSQSQTEKEHEKEHEKLKQEAIFKRNNIFPGMVDYFKDLGFEASVDGYIISIIV